MTPTVATSSPRSGEDRTYAVDWASMGTGHVGYEIALVMGLAGGAVWFDALQADPANEAMAERIAGHPLTAVAEQ